MSDLMKALLMLIGLLAALAAVAETRILGAPYGKTIVIQAAR